MASSEIDGTIGTAYNGAVAYAILLTGGRPNGIVTSDVVASGSFALKGLAAGTYQLKIVINDRQIGQGQAGNDISNLLTTNVITVDGSSTYHV